MKCGTRELIVFALAVSASCLFFRYRGEIKCVAIASEQSQSVVAENGELIVWSSESPGGKTWANLGTGGKIEFLDNSGLNSSGKALTIRTGLEGFRSCGLNWKGWYPAEACDDVTRFCSLVFHIRQATAACDADLSISLVDNLKRDDNPVPGNSVSIVSDGILPRIDGQWRKVVIPLSKFAQNRSLRLDRLWEINFAHKGKGQVAFQIDRIAFSMDKGNTTPSFPIQPAFRAAARVDCDAPACRISEGIYGVCNLPEDRLRHYGIVVTRWGGNTSSRYNWKLNADNGAADWYFGNRGAPIRNLDETGYLRHLRTAQAARGTAYITVPMLGWVAKDNSSYSFPVKKHGPQKEADPANSDAGNGIRRDGTLIWAADPTDTSLAVGPDFVEEAVAFVVRQAGKADGKGVKYWVLDNEPMLWHQTHRDVRHEPLGYDELWERTVKYAEAIKRADPTAKVAGFCSWGWSDLFYSATDEASNHYARPDHHAHGSVPLAEWFIRKCGEYKKKHGMSVVDVFDFHWYPQGRLNGKTPYLGKGMDPKLNELRLRSTRDLWDPSYRQESWIDEASPGQATKVIRRIREWIDLHNPGMEISLGEYNFGGGDNITGGLAQADAFGILSREKVDLAFIWSAPEGTQNLAWTLFRNYDGCGGRFGESLIPAVSDHSDVAIYASRCRDGAITLVAINRNLGGPCEFAVNIAGIQGQLRSWCFEPSCENVHEVTTEHKRIDGNFSIKLPAASATILVIR
jgi:Glycoside hydrolase family 44